MTETAEKTEPKDFGWVLLELMGHRQRIGQAREEQVGGGLMLRIDVPTDDDEDGEYVTEYYGTSSIYAMRPVSAEVARDHYARTDPRPTKPAEYKPASQIEHRDDFGDDEPNF